MKSTLAFEAIGTAWEIDIKASLEETQKRSLFEAVSQTIEIYDRLLSRFRSDSWISQLAGQADTYALPSEVQGLFHLYKQLYHLTDGLFSPLVGQLLVDTGYDADYSLSVGKVQPVPAWNEVIALTDTSLRLKQPALLDFGAAGKGCVVDAVVEILQRDDMPSFCVDAGGDMYFRDVDGESLSVGLEHPLDTSQVIGVVQLHSGQALCASASNRRRWRDWHHLVNPLTLKPVDDVLATWVVAADTMTADALATALFLVKPERLSPHFEFDYLVMYPDSRVSRSSNFQAELFIRQ